MALTPDEEQKIARLGSVMQDIDAGIESMNSTLTGALRMARIGREALDRIGCECDTRDSYGLGIVVDETCVRCKALADMAAVAKEFTP